MALIPCPECRRDISTEAKMCPGCGYPLAERLRANPETASGTQASTPVGSAATNPGAPSNPTVASSRTQPPPDTQKTLLVVRPSWWNFGWHLVFCWLVVPFLIALYRRHSFVMRIYSDRVSVEEGFWSRESSEFFIKDIRAIDVQQGLWGRLVDIGDVTISTAATIDAAELAPGVPQPQKIKELLIAQRQQSGS